MTDNSNPELDGSELDPSELIVDNSDLIIDESDSIIAVAGLQAGELKSGRPYQVWGIKTVKIEDATKDDLASFAALTIGGWVKGPDAEHYQILEKLVYSGAFTPGGSFAEDVCIIYYTDTSFPGCNDALRSLVRRGQFAASYLYYPPELRLMKEYFDRTIQVRVMQYVRMEMTITDELRQSIWADEIVGLPLFNAIQELKPDTPLNELFEKLRQPVKTMIDKGQLGGKSRYRAKLADSKKEVSLDSDHGDRDPVDEDGLTAAEKKIKEVEERMAAGEDDTEAIYDEMEQREDAKRDLKKIADQLSESDQELVELILEELSTKEIAEKLGKSVGATYKQIQRMKERVQRIELRQTRDKARYSYLSKLLDEL